MGKNLFRSAGINPIELAQDVEMQARLTGFWSKFLQENGGWTGRKVPPIGYTDSPTLPVSIINSWDTLQRGGSSMLIPQISRYYGPPLLGTNDLMQGSGEDSKITYRTIKIRPWRKAFDVPTGEDEQALRDQVRAKMTVDGIKSRAIDYSGRVFDHNCWLTMLSGYDMTQTVYTDYTGKLAVRTPFSHPNFYVAGKGKVKFAGSTGRPGSAAYETALIAKLNTIADNGITANRIGALVVNAGRHLISTLETKWINKRVVLMNDAGIQQLMLDTKLVDNMRHALPRGLDNPLFSGAEIVTNNAVIYNAPGAWGIQTSDDGTVAVSANSTLGMPAYGPSGSWFSETGEAEDQNDIAFAYVVGMGALDRAYGRERRIKFTTEDWDHESRLEVGMTTWGNLMRCEMFDDDNSFGNGAGAFFQNSGSAVLAFKCPYELSI